VNAVEGVGRSAQGPYKEGTPSNQIGGWLGGDAIQVKVVLHKQWVFAVKQAPPAFPEFKLEEIEEGKAAVSFTATDLRAIARWCLQFGDGISVQEPARLLDRMRQVASAWGVKGAPAPAAAAPAAKPAPKSEGREPRHEGGRESRHEGREPRHERHESKSEPSRYEPRPEGDTHRHRDRKEHRESREREESPKPANGRTEVRIERL
jgi:hypothetical protein